MNLRIWRWPLALGALTALGLLSALLADGAWDALSWLALGVPVFACGWFGWRRAEPRCHVVPAPTAAERQPEVLSLRQPEHTP